MIHLDLATEQGATIYFDVHRIEPGGDGFAVTGTLGDGLDEGEVLVETGDGVEVTFVDEWLGGGGGQRLVRRAGREEVVQALTEAVRRMYFCLAAPVDAEGLRLQVTGFQLDGLAIPLRPREYGEQLELPLVCEPLPVWGEAA